MIPSIGLLHRWKIQILGESDPVEEQLKDIARQGSRLAGWAHLCAIALIVLFSLGSLVALSGEALVYVVRDGWAPQSIPRAISVAVSTLMVVAMDVGMLYAASMLRILNARRADDDEKRLHVVVIVGVAILEAGTYIYMSWIYEQPAGVAWGLIIARAIAAPLLGIYLSLARPLPVGPRDILYQVELSTGKGVIRDAVTIANDTSAPLAQKMRLYGASAVMTPGDAQRLTDMIAVMQEGQPQTVIVEDFPPLPPGPPSDAPDRRDEVGEAHQRESAAETIAPPAQLRIVPTPKQARRRARGNAIGEMSEHELEVYGFALLDANPKLPKTRFRVRLGKRYEAADRIYTRWHNQRKNAAVGAE